VLKLTLIWQFSINSSIDVSSAEILVPFLFNTICLMYFFWNAYQSDPGVIRTSRQEKLQVFCVKNLSILFYIESRILVMFEKKTLT